MTSLIASAIRMYLFNYFSSCRHHTVDMCVAVATDDGLITPIVTQAERKVGS